MSGFTLIEGDKQLEQACAQLSGISVVALDTEFMREKTYFPILCLVQLRSDGASFLIDALAIQNLTPLKSLIANDKVETVIHSCRQDMEALDRRMDVSFGQLFDTQIAAAFLGLGEQVSYAALVEKVSGVTLSKAFTRADWSRRPLSQEELIYAAEDVEYLEPIRDYLTAQLEDCGRMPWFRKECELQQDAALWNIDPDQAWKRVKGIGALSPTSQKIAKVLASWREQRAIESDKPREWILRTQALLAISAAQPESVNALSHIEEVPPAIVRKQGEYLVHICQQASRDEAGEVILKPKIPTQEEKARVKGIMKQLQSTAEDISISPSLLANRASIENFVFHGADIRLFHGWRREVIGERILEEFS